MAWAVRNSFPQVVVFVAAACCSVQSVTAAGLQEPSLRAGSASFQLQNPSNAVIEQTSSKAIIDWRAFSLAPGDRLTFVQPNTSAIALNRVTGTQASVINGQLLGNGQVWLLNPNGLLIGKTGQVNTHGFLATTLGLTNAHFLEGRYVFQANETHAAEASLLNQGRIVSGTGGYALLAGRKVHNAGLIQAELGHVVLGAGSTATLDLVGDGLLKFAVNAPADGEGPASGPRIENTPSGQLRAPGGRVLLTAQAATDFISQVVNVEGLVQATSVQQVNGEIVIEGGSNGTVAVSGTLDSSGSSGQSGGDIKVFGQSLHLTNKAVLNATGDTGGGGIYLGGGWQGALVDGRSSALKLRIDAGALVDSSALGRGQGGTVVAWSDVKNPQSQTFAHGSFKARGGVQGGDGGRIETSGYWLGTQGIQVDTGAVHGRLGQWLLDPSLLVVFSAAEFSALNVTAPISDGTTGLMPAANTASYVLDSDINAALQNATIIELQADDIYLSKFVSLTVPDARILRFDTLSGGLHSAAYDTSTSSFITDSQLVNAPIINLASTAPNSATIEINQAGGSSFVGKILGTGLVHKLGVGSLTLGGLPEEAMTRIEAGTLKLSSSELQSGMGLPYGGLEVLGGQLDLNGQALSPLRTLKLKGTTGEGALTNSSSQPALFKGPIFLLDNTKISSAGELSLGDVEGLGTAVAQPLVSISADRKTLTVSAASLLTDLTAGTKLFVLDCGISASCYSYGIDDQYFAVVDSVDSANLSFSITEPLPQSIGSVVGSYTGFAPILQSSALTLAPHSSVTQSNIHWLGNVSAASITALAGLSIHAKKDFSSGSSNGQRIRSLTDQTYSSLVKVTNTGTQDSFSGAATIASGQQALEFESLALTGGTLRFGGDLVSTTDGQGLVYVTAWNFDGDGDLLTTIPKGQVIFEGDIGASSARPAGLFVAAGDVTFDKKTNANASNVLLKGAGQGYSSFGLMASNQSIKVSSQGLVLSAESGDIYLRGLWAPLTSGQTPSITLKTNQQLYLAGGLGSATSPFGSLVVEAAGLRAIDPSIAGCGLSPSQNLNCADISGFASSSFSLTAAQLEGNLVDALLSTRQAQSLAQSQAQADADAAAQLAAQLEAEAAAQEAARLAAEEEAQRLAEEEARRLAEEEAKRLAEEEARRLAEEEAKRLAEEEARRLAEEEAKRLAEEEARRLAEEEARRLAAEEAARLAAEKAAQLAQQIQASGGSLDPEGAAEILKIAESTGLSPEELAYASKNLQKDEIVRAAELSATLGLDFKTLAVATDKLGTDVVTSLASVATKTGGTLTEVLTQANDQAAQATRAAPAQPVSAPLEPSASQTSPPSQASSEPAVGSSVTSPSPGPSPAPSPSPSPDPIASPAGGPPDTTSPAAALPDSNPPAAVSSPTVVTNASPPPPQTPVAPPPPSPVPQQKPETPKDVADASDATLASVVKPEPSKPANQPQRMVVKTVPVIPGGLVNVQVPLPPRPPSVTALDKKIPSLGNSARW